MQGRERAFNGPLQVFQRDELLFPVIPAHQHTLAVLNILGTDLQPQGTPCISYWAYFQPGELSLASSFTRNFSESRS